MSKIEYQCSNCGKRFCTRPMAGVPQGMYNLGVRAIGDAVYCEDCVKTWKERNGKEFDEMVKNPQKLFSAWWNREVIMQNPRSAVKTCRQLANGDFVEC